MDEPQPQPDAADEAPPAALVALTPRQRQIVVAGTRAAGQALQRAASDTLQGETLSGDVVMHIVARVLALAVVEASKPEPWPRVVVADPRADRARGAAAARRGAR